MNQRSSLRPVTPHGIIAANLEHLRERAAALSYVDPEFSSVLDETARLASGLETYLVASTSPASPILRDLAADSADRPWTDLHANGATAVPLEAEMLSGHVEGMFLNFLVRATRATRILEIGLFTGYSALAMAEALPENGTLVACEIDRYVAGIARSWFDRSPHGRKIRVEVAPAAETLRALAASGERFDLIFIDADKASYGAYFESIFGGSLLAENGLVCVDNTLMQGEPYRSETRTANGAAIAEFNRLVANDRRVECVMLPVRDGLTIVRRTAT